MKRIVGFGLAVLVNALFVAVFAWSSSPVPDGEVLITNVSNGARIVVASKSFGAGVAAADDRTVR